MVFIKSRLVLGVISKVIKTALKAVYKILAFLNLQYALFVLTVGLILLILGAMEITAVKIMFYVLLATSLLAAIIISFKKIIGKTDGNKSERRVKPTKPQREESEKQEKKENVAVSEPPFEKDEKNSTVYYAVKGKPGYYMAEFDDRYELYFNKKGVFKRVRVDYKKKDD